MKRSLFAATIFVIATMLWVGIPGNALKQPASPHGIVSLELAYAADSAAKIISAWQQQGILHIAITNVYTDFAFIAAYTIFLLRLLKAVTRKQQEKIKTAAAIVSKATITAGCCDVVENLFMLPMLYGHISNFFATGAGVFATVKFGLIAVILLFIILLFMAGLFRKSKGHKAKLDNYSY